VFWCRASIQRVVRAGAGRRERVCGYTRRGLPPRSKNLSVIEKRGLFSRWPEKGARTLAVKTHAPKASLSPTADRTKMGVSGRRAAVLDNPDSGVGLSGGGGDSDGSPGAKPYTSGLSPPPRRRTLHTPAAVSRAIHTR